MMRVEPVRTHNLARYIRYVLAHGSEHDGSFLPGAGFAVSREHPGYIALRDGEVVGAVSLMRTRRYLQARRGRFSLFHAIEPASQTYPLLFGAIRRHFEDLRSVHLFLPEDREAAAQAILRLGFAVERCSYVMKLENANPSGVVVPDGLALRTIRPGETECHRLYADAINANFAGLAGHIPMQPDLLDDWMKEDSSLEEGYALLLAGDRAVGTVSVMRDVDDRTAGEVAALSVARQKRHQGLGRLLLRHAICFATWRGLRPIFLSLNAESASALRLYQSEGFVITGTMVCYSMDCSPGALDAP